MKLQLLGLAMSLSVICYAQDVRVVIQNDTIDTSISSFGNQRLQLTSVGTVSADAIQILYLFSRPKADLSSFLNRHSFNYQVTDYPDNFSPRPIIERPQLQTVNISVQDFPRYYQQRQTATFLKVLGAVMISSAIIVSQLDYPEDLSLEELQQMADTRRSVSLGLGTAGGLSLSAGFVIDLQSNKLLKPSK